MNDPFRVQRMMAAQIQAQRPARAHVLLEARRDRARAGAIRDTYPELAAQLDERALRFRAEARERLREYLQSWQQERRNMASGVSAEDFFTIATGFIGIEGYIALPDYGGLQELRDAASEARVAALRASGPKNGRAWHQ